MGFGVINSFGWTLFSEQSNRSAGLEAGHVTWREWMWSESEASECEAIEYGASENEESEYETSECEANARLRSQRDREIASIEGSSKGSKQSQRSSYLAKLATKVTGINWNWLWKEWLSTDCRKTAAITTDIVMRSSQQGAESSRQFDWSNGILVEDCSNRSVKKRKLPSSSWVVLDTQNSGNRPPLCCLSGKESLQ